MNQQIKRKKKKVENSFTAEDSRATHLDIIAGNILRCTYMERAMRFRKSLKLQSKGRNGEFLQRRVISHPTIELRKN